MTNVGVVVAKKKKKKIPTTPHRAFSVRVSASLRSLDGEFFSPYKKGIFVGKGRALGKASLTPLGRRVGLRLLFTLTPLLCTGALPGWEATNGCAGRLRLAMESTCCFQERLSFCFLEQECANPGTPGAGE